MRRGRRTKKAEEPIGDASKEQREERKKQHTIGRGLDNSKRRKPTFPRESPNIIIERTIKKQKKKQKKKRSEHVYYAVVRRVK